MMGFTRAYGVRYYLGKTLITIALIYAGAYVLKYNRNDWTHKNGFRVLSSRPVCNPGDRGFPQVSPRTEPHHYAARGFNDSPI